MKNLVLIGMPGSGKTSFGKAVAERLQCRFYDADEYLEAQEKRKIKEIFQVEGEAAFRTMETEVLHRLSHMEGVVIATGGGAVLRRDNMEFLSRAGLICWVDRPVERIMEDIDISGRPLVAAGRERLLTLYRERVGLYKLWSQIRIQNDDDFETVMERMIKETEAWL